MSYAIIQTGGKQYKVKAGEILKIERLEDSKLETKVEFKEIQPMEMIKILKLGHQQLKVQKLKQTLLKMERIEQY